MKHFARNKPSRTDAPQSDMLLGSPFRTNATRVNSFSFKGYSRAMSTKIGPRILDAAIVLFSEYGYFGVTTRDIAKKAKTTEGSIYRLFVSKEKLFEEALNAVISRALDPTQILIMIFENRKKQEFPALISAAVRSWYSCMPQVSARLLIHACLSKNNKWRETASAPIEKIIGILTTGIEREMEKAKYRKFNAGVVVRALILALFQFKITQAPLRPASEEARFVEGAIEQWLQGLVESNQA